MPHKSNSLAADLDGIAVDDRRLAGDLGRDRPRQR
jgi:hypothetical protein